MAVLIRPKLWGLQKPPVGAQVNWGHPLAGGLGALVIANQGGGYPVEQVRRQIGSPVGGSSFGWRVSQGGLGVTDTAQWLGNYGDILASRFTVAWWLTLQSFPGSNFPGISIFTYASESSNAGAGLQIRPSRGATFILFANSGQGSYASISDAATPLGPSFYVATYDGTTGRLYRNGVPVASGTPPYVAPPLSTPIGNSNLWGGTVTSHQSAVWSRALSQSEIQWLNAEPYAFMAPQAPRQRYWALGGATTYSGWGILN